MLKAFANVWKIDRGLPLGINQQLSFLNFYILILKYFISQQFYIYINKF